MEIFLNVICSFNALCTILGYFAWIYVLLLFMQFFLYLLCVFCVIDIEFFIFNSFASCTLFYLIGSLSFMLCLFFFMKCCVLFCEIALKIYISIIIIIIILSLSLLLCYKACYQNWSRG